MTGRSPPPFSLTPPPCMPGLSLEEARKRKEGPCRWSFGSDGFILDFIVRAAAILLLSFFFLILLLTSLLFLGLLLSSNIVFPFSDYDVPRLTGKGGGVDDFLYIPLSA